MWSLRRRAARAVVLDPDDRVLLLEARDPADSRKGTWLELPGGGVEPGESTADAAARELHEETGLIPNEVGGCVWTHRARFVFAGLGFDQEEFVHVCRASDGGDGVYRPGGLEPIEAQAFKGIRWWTLDDLDGHVAAGGRVIPPWLPAELRYYLRTGPPPEPVDMGELGDLFA